VHAVCMCGVASYWLSSSAYLLMLLLIMLCCHRSERIWTVTVGQSLDYCTVYEHMTVHSIGLGNSYHSIE